MIVPLGSGGTGIRLTYERDPVVIPSSDWLAKCTWMRLDDRPISARSGLEELASVACTNTAQALPSLKLDCAAGTCRIAIPAGMTSVSLGGRIVMAVSAYCITRGSDTFRGKFYDPPSVDTPDDVFLARAPRLPTTESGKGAACEATVALLGDMLCDELLGLDPRQFYDRLVALTAVLRNIPPTAIFLVRRISRLEIAVAVAHLPAIGKLLHGGEMPSPGKSTSCKVLAGVSTVPAGGSSTSCQIAFDAIAGLGNAAAAPSKGASTSCQVAFDSAAGIPTRVRRALFGLSPKQQREQAERMEQREWNTTCRAGRRMADDDDDDDGTVIVWGYRTTTTTPAGGPVCDELRYTKAGDFLRAMRYKADDPSNYEKLRPILIPNGLAIKKFLATHIVHVEKGSTSAAHMLGAYSDARVVTEGCPIVHTPEVYDAIVQVFRASTHAKELLARLDTVYCQSMTGDVQGGAP